MGQKLQNPQHKNNMKLKLTFLIMQADNRFDIMSPDFLKVLVDENDNLPSTYVSTKSIEETVQQLYSKVSCLDCHWASPILSDLRHEAGSTECEALYRVLVPEGTVGPKKGKLIEPHLLELEDFYVRGIIESPRSVSQQF
jgi:hypothetical protein